MILVDFFLALGNDFIVYNVFTEWDVTMPPKTFDISCLPDNLTGFLADIQNHVEITLTLDGVPWAKIVPWVSDQEIKSSVADLNRDAIAISDDFDDESEEINSMFYDSVIFPD